MVIECVVLFGIRWMNGPIPTPKIGRNGYVVTQHFVVLLSQFTLPPMLRTTLRAALSASRRPALRPTIARRCMSTSEDKMRGRATTGVCVHYGLNGTRSRSEGLMVFIT